MCRAILRLTTLPLLWILYSLSWLVPRDMALIVFGTENDTFTDNPKYAFLDFALTPAKTKYNKTIRVAWISGNHETIKQLNLHKLEAYHRWSFQGIMLALRAATYVYSGHASDINFWCSGGALLVNLWHGIPLKNIEFDTQEGPYKNIFQAKGIKKFIKTLSLPYVYFQPTYVLATSPKVAEIFKSAFRINTDQLLISSYPRISPLAHAGAYPKTIKFINDENKTLRARIRSLSIGCRTILYAPTWRDTSINFIDDFADQFKILDDTLGNNKLTMFVKLHPCSNSTLLDAKIFQNIHLIKTPDINGCLEAFDYLITDYSSIYFDFLYLDREIIFFPFDLENYTKACRSFYFNYIIAAPGLHVKTWKQLGDALNKLDKLNYSPQRKYVGTMVWGEHFSTRTINTNNLHTCLRRTGNNL